MSCRVVLSFLLLLSCIELSVLCCRLCCVFAYTLICSVVVVVVVCFPIGCSAVSPECPSLCKVVHLPYACPKCDCSSLVQGKAVHS